MNFPAYIIHINAIAEGQYMSSHSSQKIENILTIMDFDGHSMSRIFSFNDRSHAKDKKISKAGYESYNPDKYFPWLTV